MRNNMTSYRASCARVVIEAVKDRGLDRRAAIIAITTVIVETRLENISEKVDHTSLGLFQQQDPWGSSSQRLNPTWATNAFLNKMISLYPNGAWMSAPIGEVCQAVQVSGYPARYQPQAGDARIIVDSLWQDPEPGDEEGPARARADVTGDGLDDLVVLYDYGSSTSKLWVFRSIVDSTGKGHRYEDPVEWWGSTPGNWAWSSSKLVVGNFAKDADGVERADVGILYDYGGANTGLLVFRSTGKKFDAPVAWWSFNPGNWSWSSSKLVVGKFNDDDLDDVGILYDYGDATTTLWVLRSTGGAFTAPDPWWEFNPGNWSWSNSKLVAGNFNDDKLTDVAIMYDYGGATTTLWVLRSIGNDFTAPDPWWEFNPGNWSWSNSKLVAGNFNDDKLTDVAIMYDYGGATTTLWVLRSIGNDFTAPDPWWEFNPGNWSWSNSKLVAGNFNDDKLTDVAIMYDYGGATTTLWTLRSIGNDFTAPDPWWESDPGNWAWSNSKLS
ncbi:hypothetical protein [Plantactinospora veratri]